MSAWLVDANGLPLTSRQLVGALMLLIPMTLVVVGLVILLGGLGWGWWEEQPPKARRESAIVGATLLAVWSYLALASWLGR